jgi:chemotaxis response regulator CheB
VNVAIDTLAIGAGHISAAMGDYTIQISTKLIDQLARDDEKVKRKVRKPKPKKKPTVKPHEEPLEFSNPSAPS